MTIHGTNHFPSMYYAVAYYTPYGFSAEDVQEKLKAGEIAIGIPEAKPGERVYLNENEGRYFAEKKEG